MPVKQAYRGDRNAHQICADETDEQPSLCGAVVFEVGEQETEDGDSAEEDAVVLRQESGIVVGDVEPVEATSDQGTRGVLQRIRRRSCCGRE